MVLTVAISVVALLFAIAGVVGAIYTQVTMKRIRADRDATEEALDGIQTAAKFGTLAPLYTSDPAMVARALGLDPAVRRN